jgi:crotonobetainyl-CoA:carnitine CoA-transferase CaiB-like acyl-CoA transferase
MELAHAAAGKVALVRSPMRFSGTPVEHGVPPPTLGQHTFEVLSSLLKKTPSEIERLRSEGIV